MYILLLFFFILYTRLLIEIRASSHNFFVFLIVFNFQIKKKYHHYYFTLSTFKQAISSFFWTAKRIHKKSLCFHPLTLSKNVLSLYVCAYVGTFPLNSLHMNVFPKYIVTKLIRIKSAIVWFGNMATKYLFFYCHC